jgi:metal-sulfur cluster biosynthetic enzyme
MQQTKSESKYRSVEVDDLSHNTVKICFTLTGKKCRLFKNLQLIIENCLKVMQYFLNRTTVKLVYKPETPKSGRY